MLLVCLGMVLFLWTGCSGCAQARAGSPETFVIAEFEFAGDSPAWGPDKEVVTLWFEQALRSSDRGFKAQGEGLALRAQVDYRLLVIERPRGALLRIDVDVQLEPIFQGEGLSIPAITASVQHRHPFAVPIPSEALLAPLSQTLLRDGIDKVVLSLRDQAVVRLTLERNLGAAIRSEEHSTPARLIAIDRVVSAEILEAEDALLVATESSEPEIATAAARGLHRLKTPSSSKALLKVAQRMSRDRHYEHFEALLPLLATCQEPYIHLYLETVADAHRLRRIRDQARQLVETWPVGDELQGSTLSDGP